MSPKVVFISRYDVNEEGHGGYHRTYQIWHDLCRLVGEENVIPINLVPHVHSNNQGNILNNYRKELIHRLKYLGKYLSHHGDPYRIYVDQLFEISASRPFFGRVSTSEYQEQISTLDKPIICVIDHPNQGNIISINAQLGIPTFYCPQNLETFDIVAGSFEDKFRKASFYPRFLREFNLISECNERLSISKVEAGLLGGLGLPTVYYPYLPVGVIREGLETIRHSRENNKYINRNHFLMFGNAFHHTTYKSFSWFIDQAVEHGLPTDIQITIVGKHTEDLISDTALPSCFDIRGWLSQESLDDLMCKVNAAIIPQQIGFGALTRLPELSCAGVPAIVSSHSTCAINTPPGIFPVNDTWIDWSRKIEELSNSSIHPSSIDYLSWEKEQPKPLGSIIERWL